jgi:hypothetical protein
MTIKARPIPEELKGDEIVFPSGLYINYDSDISTEYIRDRASLNLNDLIDKWSPLCPEIRSKSKMDLLAPPTILKIASLASEFNVAEGVIFMQLWNHGLVGLGTHDQSVYFLETNNLQK